MNENGTRAAIEHLRGLTIAHLANDADCSLPDAETSAGGRFLDNVRDAVAEAIEYAPVLLDDPDDATDTIAEIADNAPDVYTATKWEEFVDLGAWQEDPTDLGFDCSDVDKVASACLYIIAERLAATLLRDAAEYVAELLTDDAEGVSR